MKYIKTTAVIEAIQYNNLNDYVKMIDRWPDFERFVSKVDNFDYTFKIETLNGVLTIRPKDYIIKGIKGEFYPCKADIFEMTYEKVQDEN